MRNPLLTWTFAALSATTTLAQGRPKATVEPFVETDGVHAGTSVRVALRVTLPDGIHVQSDKPRDPMLIATTLAAAPPAGVTVGNIRYPATTDFKQAGQSAPLAVFEQQFVVGATLTLDRSVATGPLAVPVRFRYQACDASTCFAPTREEVSWTLSVVPAATPTPKKFVDVFAQVQRPGVRP